MGEALEDRKNALNAYLKEMCRREDISSSSQVLSFFGIYAHSAGGYPEAQGSGATPYANATEGRSAQPKKAPVRKNSGSDDDLIGWDRWEKPRRLSYDHELCV